MGRLRNTKQKNILDEEIKKFTSYFTVDQLYLKVKDNNIGIATIYRYLKEMVYSTKLFSYTCDRKTVYSHKKISHCHFICEKSGKIIHFDVDSLDFLKRKIPGDITSFQIEVRGNCNECQ